jgi:hypothetical protein
MARFDEIHRRELHAADGRIREGETWRIALREPLEFAALGPGTIPPDACVKIVQFVASGRGSLEPASMADRELIADWKRRHRDTPPEWFSLPDGLQR